MGVVLTVFLGIILIIFLGKAAERPGFQRFAAAGLVTGLYLLVRPNLLLFIPAAAGWIFWILVRRKQIRKYPLYLGGFLLAAALAILPPAIRNYSVSGETVPISTNLGVSLAVANNPITDGTTHLIPGIGDIGTPFDWPRIVRLLERKLGRDLTHRQASNLLASRALRFIRKNPTRFIGLLGRKALLFWGPFEIRNLKEVHYARKDSKLLQAIPLNFTLILALGTVGFLLLVSDYKKEKEPSDFSKRRFEMTVLAGCFIIFYFFSVLPFAAAARYRVPIIPFLLLFSSCALVMIVNLFWKKELIKAVFWTVLAVFSYILFSINYTGYRPALEKWHYDLGLAYVRQGTFDRAIEEYERSLEAKPDFTKAYNNLGSIYSLRGEYRRAKECYRRALEADRNLARARNNLGNVLYKEGRRPRRWRS